MIIDLDLDLYVYIPKEGLHKVSLIDLNNQQVTTDDGETYNIKEVALTHKY